MTAIRRSSSARSSRRSSSQRHARVSDHGVEAPEAVEGGGHAAPARLGERDPSPRLRRPRRRGRSHRRRDQDEVPAGVGEALRAGEPDPARRARDDRLRDARDGRRVRALGRDAASPPAPALRAGPHRVHEGDQLVQVRGRVPLDVVGGEAGRQAVGRQSLDARGGWPAANPQRGPLPTSSAEHSNPYPALRALSITPTAPSSNSSTISALPPAPEARTRRPRRRASARSPCRGPPCPRTGSRAGRWPARRGGSRLRCEIRTAAPRRRRPRRSPALGPSRGRSAAGTRPAGHARRLSRAARLAPAGRSSEIGFSQKTCSRAHRGPSRPSRRGAATASRSRSPRRRRRRAPLRGSATRALPAPSPGCVRPAFGTGSTSRDQPRPRHPPGEVSRVEAPDRTEARSTATPRLAVDTPGSLRVELDRDHPPIGRHGGRNRPATGGTGHDLPPSRRTRTIPAWSRPDVRRACSTDPGRPCWTRRWRTAWAQIEACAGGHIPTAHYDPRQPRGDREALRRFRPRSRSAGLRLCSLSCHGNPIHPDPEARAASDHEDFAATCAVASALGVRHVSLLAGLPAGAPGDVTPNWIVNSAFPGLDETYEWQWQERVLPYWRRAGELADDHGRAALHRATLGGRRLQHAHLPAPARGGRPPIAMNFDPSHLWWQGIDPLAVLEGRRRDPHLPCEGRPDRRPPRSRRRGRSRRSPTTAGTSARGPSPRPATATRSLFWR